MSTQTLVERTLFLGPRIPNHIKLLHKNLVTLKKPVFQQLLKLAVQDFEGKNVTPNMYMSIKGAVDEESCNIDLIYGSLYMLLKCALSLPESSLKQEVFKEDLQALKIPNEFIEDLVRVVFGARKVAIKDNFLKVVPHIPKLKQLRWRIDVAISTSSLSRVLEPVIVMEIQLSNDQKKIFEVHPSQFHQLRFAVATLLKEIENVETRNVLKY